MLLLSILAGISPFPAALLEDNFKGFFLDVKLADAIKFQARFRKKISQLNPVNTFMILKGILSRFALGSIFVDLSFGEW